MNDLNEIKTEKELLHKLFTTEHLNVSERKSLPNGVVRESSARELISAHVKEHGWFPGVKQKPVGNSGGEYFQIEYKEKGNIVFHHNYESSYLKFEHHTNKLNSLNELITFYLKEKQKEGLDGLKIEWGA